METGWIVAIVLGVALAVVILVVVVWVVLRREQREAETMQSPVPLETLSEHERHSVSKQVNDRWEALLRSWEAEDAAAAAAPGM